MRARRPFLALLAGAPALAACGLRPIYARGERQKVLPDLAAIEVGPQYGSRGELLVDLERFATAYGLA